MNYTTLKQQNQKLIKANNALNQEIQYLLKLLHEAAFPNEIDESDEPDDSIEVEKCILDGVLYYKTRENVLLDPKDLAIVGRLIDHKIVKFTPPQ